MYEKQTWEDSPSTATPVTATRLGHMEDGIEAASLVVPFVGMNGNDQAGQSWGLPGVVFSSTGTDQRTKDTAYYFPFAVQYACTVTKAHVQVTTQGSASSVGRLALYTANAYAIPQALVQDFGTVAIDSTGVKTITGLSRALTVGGRYALYFNNNSTTNVTLRSRFTMSDPVGIRSSSFDQNPTAISHSETYPTGGAGAPGVVSALTGGYGSGFPMNVFLTWTIT